MVKEKDSNGKEKDSNGASMEFLFNFIDYHIVKVKGKGMCIFCGDQSSIENVDSLIAKVKADEVLRLCEKCNSIHMDICEDYSRDINRGPASDIILNKLWERCKK